MTERKNIMADLVPLASNAAAVAINRHATQQDGGDAA